MHQTNSWQGHNDTFGYTMFIGFSSQHRCLLGCGQRKMIQPNALMFCSQSKYWRVSFVSWRSKICRPPQVSFRWSIVHVFLLHRESVLAPCTIKASTTVLQSLISFAVAYLLTTAMKASYTSFTLLRLPLYNDHDWPHAKASILITNIHVEKES